MAALKRLAAFWKSELVPEHRGSTALLLTFGSGALESSRGYKSCTHILAYSNVREYYLVAALTQAIDRIASR